MKSINCKGRMIDFEVPKVMGILNVTPNSFYDGGRHNSIDKLLAQTAQMLAEGAAIIDVGAYSTQPNAPFVSEEEELQRIVPVITELVTAFPDIVLSIDTFRAQVAAHTLEAGAAIINDVSAGFLDPDMLHVVGSYKAPYIMMHMKGTPQNMQQFTDYEDVMHDMIYYFSERVEAAHKHGITDLILDPGFGFSKTLDQNYEVLNKLDLLHAFDLPVLSALSRKSMIYKFFKYSSAEALNGTTVLNTLSLMKGAHLLRVHDVKEAVECVRLYEKTTKLSNKI